MLRLLSSLKLTLFLLLALAAISVFGTLKPAVNNQYEAYYQTAGFRIVLGLLALNLLVCTLRSLPAKWRYRQQLLQTLGEKTSPASQLNGLPNLADAAERFQTEGYRITAAPGQLLVDKYAFGRWGVVLVHLSLLLIMLGGLLGEAGFVGTINTYVGQPVQRYFDWGVEAERELGFTLRVEDFNARYYPIPLRFRLVKSSTGQELGSLTLRDDGRFTVPGFDYTVLLRGFDPNRQVLTMDVLQDDVRLGKYLVGRDVERFGEERDPGFRLMDVEYQDPQLQQMAAEVSVHAGGEVVRRDVVRVNEPLRYHGVTLYLIAFDYHQPGRWSVGFQLSRDPGEWLVWSAALLLMLGLALAFLLRPRALGIKAGPRGVEIYPLGGWQGAAGRERLQALLNKLSANR